LARDVIESEVRKTPPPKIPDLGRPRPVFVTIERDNKVLGCRGSLATRKGSLGDEVAEAARSACAHDPRYRPVRERDLDRFLVTVTLVDRLDPIDNMASLQPEDGLVLTAGSRSGIVLPWEGKDPATRLRWAYQKAGVPVGSPAKLSRMVAERWRG
jgi:AMMECR1 domain-containing protein